ncbi:hypothetical protein LPUS_11489 [Lasallia pustulata]|uniref:Uncharacterized protein n=1 Tax=Lasallia pustulata TaxID=136370 RepID=A0A1W5DBW4_9LECA|nr:hypothetical protein LPUS_11489 [Lasallia pustulata]
MDSWYQFRRHGQLKERLFDNFVKAIRPLRFEGANVIIALSPRPEDVLLVHSAMMEHSPLFKVGLSNRWSTSGKQISTDAQLPAKTTVSKYGMVLDADREGYTLVRNIEVNFDGFYWDELIACIANVAAYAEYYGLLPFVAKSLERGLNLRQIPMLNCRLMDQPALWLALGYMLRSETIFAEALRHFVGGDWVRSFAAKNPDWQDVILLAYKKQVELARTISKTDHDLYRLTLVLHTERIKSEEAKARYLARNALRDFLVENLRKPYYEVKEPSREAIYPRLLQVASRGDISIFGIGASSRLSNIFKLKVGQSKRPPQAVIEKEMRWALKEVKTVLERDLFTERCIPAQKEPQIHIYYLTHMSIDSDEMPWANEDAWNPITPDFEVNAASQAWLDQVGLGHVECDMECVEAGGLALFHQPSTSSTGDVAWDLLKEKYAPTW